MRMAKFGDDDFGDCIGSPTNLAFLDDSVRQWLVYETVQPKLSTWNLERAILYECGTQGPGPGSIADFLTQIILICPFVETRNYFLGVNFGRKMLYGHPVTVERVAFEVVGNSTVFSRSMLLENGSLVVSQTFGYFTAGNSARTKVAITEDADTPEFTTIDHVLLDLDCRFCTMRKSACTCTEEMRQRSVPHEFIRTLMWSQPAFEFFRSFIPSNVSPWGWVTPVSKNRTFASLRMKTGLATEGSDLRRMQIFSAQEALARLTITPVAFQFNGLKRPQTNRLELELDLDTTNSSEALEFPDDVAQSPGTLLSNVTLGADTYNLSGNSALLTNVTRSADTYNLSGHTALLTNGTLSTDAHDFSRSTDGHDVTGSIDTHERMKELTANDEDELDREDDKSTDSGNQKNSSTCPKCNAVFSRPYDQRRHYASVHLQEKRFKCKYCSKTFAQKGHMNVHMRGIHGERKVYQCDICGSQFSWRNNHQRHMQRIHGIKPKQHVAEAQPHAVADVI